MCGRGSRKVAEMTLQSRRSSKCYDLLAALGAGALIPLARMLVPWKSLGVLLWAELTLVVVLYVLVLALVCLPLTEYRRGIRLSFFGAVGTAGLGTASALLRRGAGLPIFPWILPVGLMSVLLVVWAIGCIAILALTHRRLKWSPVFPDGHCQRCGYSLFGLPEDRCPECGTTFDRASGRGDQTLGGPDGPDVRTNRRTEHAFVSDN